MTRSAANTGRSAHGVSAKSRLILWVRAGGRCQYAGCNISLIGDFISGSERLNKALIAHIVATAPKGPRGDPLRSHALADKLENLMLLCHSHHHLIDDEDEAGHPEHRLLTMKADHEQRIATLTEIDSARGTHLVQYAARIGDHDCPVSLDASQSATLPARYPLARGAINLEIVGTDYRDDEDAYWQLQVETLRRQFERRVADLRRTGEIGHISAFAIGPQPLLIELGRLLSDIGDVDVFQRSREPAGWSWRDDGEPIDFVVSRPTNTKAPTVAISLGISAAIADQRLHVVLGDDVAIWKIGAAAPGNDVLRHRSCLARYRTLLRQSFREIRQQHGDAIIHVFPALPVAMAVETGRVWMPKADPPLRIYDEQRGLGGFFARHEIGTISAPFAASRDSAAHRHAAAGQ